MEELTLGIGSRVQHAHYGPGGTLLLQPADAGLKPKEIPIETFFHKITMLRDRLCVMEQQINSHKVLSEEEKINLQQYLTRIYGDLSFTAPLRRPSSTLPFFAIKGFLKNLKN